MRTPRRHPVHTSRRDALRAFLAAAIGLPWLETFAPRTARAQALPNKRFVAMFSANGTIRNAWLPSGSEAAFTLASILEPLAPHQSDIVVVAGVDQQGAGGALRGITYCWDDLLLARAENTDDQHSRWPGAGKSGAPSYIMTVAALASGP